MITDPISVVSFSANQQIKTLGVVWNNNTDNFSYKIVDITRSSITKRTILSEISSIFDPLGLIGPCIITTKIILQQLWTLRLGWDDQIPDNLTAKWLKFRYLVNEFKIPPYISCIDPISVEVHGFSDASNVAYGACVYLRSVSANNDVTVRLLCAKTRVAPLKVLTIPRLELCAALMLSRLIRIISRNITIAIKYFLWCDSQVVLCWIQTPPNLLNTYVGTRISEIQELTEKCSWNYINTKRIPPI